MSKANYARIKKKKKIWAFVDDKRALAARPPMSKSFTTGYVDRGYVDLIHMK